jgi:hypothetical protein
MVLLARKGPPPPPTLFDYYPGYVSAYPGLNDELIVVLTNSTPVPLSPGDWYLTAVNISEGPVTYSILATEWPVTGRPFSITNWFTLSNSLCFTWETLPGVHYYIQGTPGLGNPEWTILTPTLTATDYSLTYCIALPSPNHFFRAVEGIVWNVPPPVLYITKTIPGYLVEWDGPVSARYQAQWTPSVPPPGWTTFTNIITSTNLVTGPFIIPGTVARFEFLDDGTQTSGFGPQRYYRVMILP